MDELELEFELDPQLAADCFVLGNFPLSRLLLMNDSNFPWFILVPRRAGVTEIYHLSETDQLTLTKESSHLAATLADIFAAKKMNLAALGNQVAQLHVHHIVRYENDLAWPGPIWGKVSPKPLTPEQVDNVRQKLAVLISGEVGFTPS